MLLCELFSNLNYIIHFLYAFRHIFVHLGNKFNGYIYGVSVWNSSISYSDALGTYEDSSIVPDQANLLLGWTHYEESPLVFVRPKSTEKERNVCDINETIASRDVCTSLPGELIVLERLLAEYDYVAFLCGQCIYFFRALIYHCGKFW